MRQPRLLRTTSQWAAIALCASLGIALFAFVDLTPEVEADFFFSTDDPQLQSARRIEQEFGSAPQIFVAAQSEGTRITSARSALSIDRSDNRPRGAGDVASPRHVRTPRARRPSIGGPVTLGSHGRQSSLVTAGRGILASRSSRSGCLAVPAGVRTPVFTAPPCRARSSSVCSSEDLVSCRVLLSMTALNAGQVPRTAPLPAECRLSAACVRLACRSREELPHA